VLNDIAVPAAKFNVDDTLGAVIVACPLTAMDLKVVSEGFLINDPLTVAAAGRSTVPLDPVICADPIHKPFC
jgi:hypothetical protein